MASPWETCWLRLPEHFRQALAAEDITADVNDARTYANLRTRHPEGHETGITDAITRFPSGPLRAPKSRKGVQLASGDP